MRDDDDRRRRMIGFLQNRYRDGVDARRRHDKILSLRANIVRCKNKNDDNKNQKNFVARSCHCDAFLGDGF